MQNYYQILGVHSGAEDFVIRAAYKALVQRYHPDKYQGSKDEALQKMHLINEAYEVLSDPVKRSNYDSSFQQQSQTQNNQSSTQEDSETERAWSIAVKYHPSVATQYSRLQMFSDELAEEFKGKLLENQVFNQSEEMARELEQEFLEERFGTDARVLKFARDLFLDGQKVAAKELNETLIVLGDSMDFNQVYIDIQKKYRPEMYAEQKRKAQERKEADEKKRRARQERRKKEIEQKIQNENTFLKAIGVAGFVFIIIYLIVEVF